MFEFRVATRYVGTQVKMVTVFANEKKTKVKIKGTKIPTKVYLVPYSQKMLFRN